MKVYLDTAFIAKYYIAEPGSPAVIELLRQAEGRFSSELTQIELRAVFHRQFREGRIAQLELRTLDLQFQKDLANQVWCLLPVSRKLIDLAAESYLTLPQDQFLRASDCLHLVTAREAGFDAIYSNDRRLLEAAPAFGLEGINVIDG